MARDPKIINFSGAGQPSDVEVERPSLLPGPLQAVRKEAVGFIRARLAALFDNADDSLFEMADRAASNTEQALFFEAMRAVRLQRHSITNGCCQRLVRELETLNDPSTFSRAKPTTNFAIDSLSLVQPDDLEQTVALDSMVGRVVERNRQALSHLAIRLNSLVKAQVDESTNPLGPAVLAQIFVDALGEMSLDIKVRLIVLKLFERYVFNPIDTLFATANAQLISAGVLPDLKGAAAQARQPTFTGGSVRTGSVYQETQESSDQERVLSLFSELIGNWRHASGDAALSRVTGGVASPPPLQSDELLGMLAQLPVEELAEGGFRRQDLRLHINQLLQGQRDQRGERRSIDRIDEDVISLVSMLFDFILEDPQLPAAVKAMIGRLQLPILRLAIADKRFFGQASHPARRLLNELARATMGWNDQDDLRRDQLHVLLESIVQRLLAEPEPHPEMFAAMHGELTSFVNSEKRRSDRLEQRTRDAEEGKARVGAARGEVASRLNRMLLGKTLPVFVVDLLRDTWSQVMQMTCLREGPDSTAMQAAESTARNLLVSIEPGGTDDLATRESLNREVREALAEGFTLLGIQAEQGAPLLVRLKQLQQMALLEPGVEQPQVQPRKKQVEAGRVEAERLPEVERAAPPLETDKPDSSSHASPQEERPPLEDSAPAAQTQVSGGIEKLAKKESVEALARPAPLSAAVSAPVVEVLEPVLAEDSVEDPDLGSSAVDARAQAWVEGLHTGSWFEFQAGENAITQRCKLAAIISFSGKYIFVNRGGMKVAEFSRVELAEHHTLGLIRLLNDNQLFDRALESVIGNLRQLQAGRNT
ncbi:MAG: DUF1631 domain-containing protein [Pseudomonas sp.]|nr:DUF1631 domain-containing protein [Pseudomonas sp.]